MGVEAVFGLVEDGLSVGFHDFVGDFFAAIGGEAVHDEGAGFGVGHEGVVDLPGAEDFDALGGLLFFAHADPDVGVDGVGICHSGDGIVGDGEVGLVREGGEEAGGGLECFGGADDDVEAAADGGPDPGAGDVAVAIAHEDDAFVFPGAEAFLNGEEVGEDLTGVFVIGEGVDGGDAGVMGEVDDVLLGEGADDGAVDHPAEDASGVFDGFTTAELDIGPGEEHGGAAEFADADFEADAGAGGGLGEDEGPLLTGEDLGGGGAILFQGGTEVDEGFDLLAGEGFDGEEVVHEGGGLFFGQDLQDFFGLTGFLIWEDF